MAKNIPPEIITKPRPRPQLPKKSVFPPLEKESVVPPPPQITQFPSTKKRGYFRWVLLFVLVAGALWGFLSVRKATVFVVPKRLTVPLSETLALSKNGEAALSFRQAELSGEERREIASQGVKEIEKRASGKIVVFNEYSAQPHRFIARTRFETKDGKVFRTPDAITVPGMKTENGKRIPGTLEITVVADEPGEEYNIPESEFTLPGLRGTPLFSGFYARSLEPMKGGFFGPTKILDSKDEESARTDMQAVLRESLQRKIKEGLASDEMFFPDGVFYVFEESKIEDVSKESDPATLVVKGKARALVFKRNELSKELAKRALPDETETLFIENLDALSFRVVDKDLVNPFLPQTISFTVSGNAAFVWPIDVDAIARALAGTPKEENAFQRVFQDQFSDTVEKARGPSSFVPFFGNFPRDPVRISVEIVAE